MLHTMKPDPATLAGMTLVVVLGASEFAGAQDVTTGKLRPDEIARLSPYLQEAAKNGAAQLKKGEALVEKGRERIEDGNGQIDDGKSLVRRGDEKVADSRERYAALARKAGGADNPDKLFAEAKRFRKVASNWEDALDMVEEGRALIDKGNAAIKKGNAEIREGTALIESGNKILADVRTAGLDGSAPAPAAP